MAILYCRSYNMKSLDYNNIHSVGLIMDGGEKMRFYKRGA